MIDNLELKDLFKVRDALVILKEFVLADYDMLSYVEKKIQDKGG
jgi:hypothetical protein